MGLHKSFEIKGGDLIENLQLEINNAQESLCNLEEGYEGSYDALLCSIQNIVDLLGADEKYRNDLLEVEADILKEIESDSDG